MPNRAATVYDVAEHAGVSIATVSRVLRRPDDVREATRERVLASVHALGYVPSASARGLAARRTGVMGLFLIDFDGMVDVAPLALDEPGSVVVTVDDGAPDPHDPMELYFDKVLRGAEVEAWRSGFVLLVGVGRGSDADSIVSDIAGRVDGLAVMAGSASDDLLEQLAKRIPVVIIAGPRREDDFDHVSVDNRAGMRTLVEHVLRERSPGRVLYVRGSEGSPDEIERFVGFRDAVERHAASTGALHVETTTAHFSRDIAHAAARELVESGELPDVVICANDQMALGIMDALREGGVSVPHRVAVTGFDGIAGGRLASPSLTTVRQPIEQLGRAAVHLLSERLADANRPPTTVRLPVEVFLRESTAP